ncbi:MAG TPA: hypothetical protein VLH10_28325, partial [Yinghuangia sp.]|nr:hypothetical protein [Yinghuangia sp.]
MSDTPRDPQGQQQYGSWDPPGGPDGYAPQAYADESAEYAYGVPQQYVPQTYDPGHPQPPYYDHGHPQIAEIPAQYDPFAPGVHTDDYGAADHSTVRETDHEGHKPGHPGDFHDAYDPRAAFEAGHTANLTPVPASEADFAPAPEAPASPAPAPASGPVPLRERVPIWHPPGLVPALITACFAAVLAAGSLAGGAAAVGGVVLLQVLTAAGWFRLHGMWPARQGIALAVLAAFAADAAVLLADDRGLRVLPGVLAAVLGVVLLQQLARRDGRPELMPALTVTLSAAMLAAFDVLYVLAARVESPGVSDGALVAAGAAAAAAAVVCAALPLPGPVGAVLGLAAAAGVGAVAGSATDLGNAWALGAGAGLMGLLGRRVAGYDHPSRFVHMTAGVALPLALAAPVV